MVPVRRNIRQRKYDGTNMCMKIVGEIKYNVEILAKRKYNCTYQSGLGQPVNANCFPHLVLNLVFLNAFSAILGVFIFFFLVFPWYITLVTIGTHFPFLLHLYNVTGVYPDTLFIVFDDTIILIIIFMIFFLT